MPQRDGRLDDTLTKSELELARSKASAQSDQPIFDRAEGILAALRRERETNHWAARVREAWREGK